MVSPPALQTISRAAGSRPRPSCRRSTRRPVRPGAGGFFAVEAIVAGLPRATLSSSGVDVGRLDVRALDFRNLGAAVPSFADPRAPAWDLSLTTRLKSALADGVQIASAELAQGEQRVGKRTFRQRVCRKLAELDA